MTDDTFMAQTAFLSFFEPNQPGFGDSPPS